MRSQAVKAHFSIFKVQLRLDRAATIARRSKIKDTKGSLQNQNEY